MITHKDNLNNLLLDKLWIMTINEQNLIIQDLSSIAAEFLETSKKEWCLNILDNNQDKTNIILQAVDNDKNVIRVQLSQFDKLKPYQIKFSLNDVVHLTKNFSNYDKIQRYLPKLIRANNL